MVFTVLGIAKKTILMNWKNKNVLSINQIVGLDKSGDSLLASSCGALLLIQGVVWVWGIRGVPGLRSLGGMAAGAVALNGIGFWWFPGVTSGGCIQCFWGAYAGRHRLLAWWPRSFWVGLGWARGSWGVSPLGWVLGGMSSGFGPVHALPPGPGLEVFGALVRLGTS
ncbi:hypothetical protein ILYODFUR_027077 [Ilyodon furcidens]|uniref:Uncharacterized protein n=1 Tax=Ilyodon furcidens TaxID=33524 RepID=A0ABV0VHI5_9TELE